MFYSFWVLFIFATSAYGICPQSVPNYNVATDIQYAKKKKSHNSVVVRIFLISIKSRHRPLEIQCLCESVLSISSYSELSIVRCQQCCSGQQRGPGIIPLIFTVVVSSSDYFLNGRLLRRFLVQILARLLHFLQSICQGRLRTPTLIEVHSHVLVWFSPWYLAMFFHNHPVVCFYRCSQCFLPVALYRID